MSTKVVGMGSEINEKEQQVTRENHDITEA